MLFSVKFLIDGDSFQNNYKSITSVDFLSPSLIPSCPNPSNRRKVKEECSVKK
jgi:hypothetical protein